MFFFFFSSRRRHTRYWRDWSSDVCSSDLSMYGCYHHHHIGPEDRRNPRQVAWLWGYVFQITFQVKPREHKLMKSSPENEPFMIHFVLQVVAGAVVLTDWVFWFIIIPYLSIKKQTDFHIVS